MTDVFMEYREEFEAYRDDAMKDIKQMSQKKDSAQKQQYEQRALGNIAEAERYLKLLESESRAGDSSQRRKMQQQVRSCRSHLEKLNNNLERARLLADSAERHQAQAQSTNAHDRVQNYQRRLDKQGDYLQTAQRTIAETEEIGNNIDVNLARQRENIERARENVDDTRDATREAGGHLSSLSRKAMTNIICLYMVIFGLLAGIGYTVYIRFIKKKEN